MWPLKTQSPRGQKTSHLRPAETAKKVKAFFNLEEQAKRSRQRRNAQLRLFAERLRPLQDNPILGWRVVDDDGMPTIDAYVFLVIAIAFQAWLWTQLLYIS